MSAAPTKQAPPAASAPATADRLRHEIDSGRTGDKVAGPDPAAAPLGTDDEAADRPPGDGRVEMARRDELQQEGVADKVTSNIWWILLGIAGACLLALLVAVVVGR